MRFTSDLFHPGWAIIVCVMALGGLAPSVAAEPDSSVSVCGVWRSVQAGTNGTWEADFLVAGNGLGGELRAHGLTRLQKVAIAGTVEGSQITFGLAYGAIEELEFTGKRQGSTYAGQFEMADGTSGTWTGTICHE